MPEPSVKESPATSATGSTNTEPSTTQSKESQYATRDEIATLLKRIDGQNARLDGQSAIINRLEKEKSKLAEEVTPKTPGQDDGLVARVKVIEERNRVADERDSKQKDREALQRIQTALIAGGADPKQAPRFAKLLHIEHGGKIVVDDEFNVSVKESDTVVNPVETWVGAYLQTEEGKVFLPSKRNPKSDGLNGKSEVAAGAKRQVTRDDLRAGRVNTKDIADGKIEVVD